MNSDPGGHSIILTLLAGAGLGILGQLASDLVYSAVEGELSFSHWTEYAGAAVGGAVGALFPNTPLLSEAIGATVSSVTTVVSYNIESEIIGREDKYSFEEALYLTVNNTITSIGTAAFFDSINIFPSLSNKFIPKTNINASAPIQAGITGAFDGLIQPAFDSYPNTHIWDPANPRRRYS